MAFERILTGKVRGSQAKPGMNIRVSTSGASQCYIGAVIRKKLRLVEVELDRANKTVRVRPNSESGAKMSGRAGGTFSLPKSFAREVVPAGEASTFLTMREGEDGWWYGSYGGEAHE